MLATDGGGNWVVVWQSQDAGSDSEIMMTRSSDNGATWTAAAPLNTNAAVDLDHDNYPTIATDRQGNWVAMWGVILSGGGDQEILVARSSDNGATWTAPEFVDAAAPGGDFEDDAYPSLATDGQGTWLAFWRRGGGESDIYTTRSTDNGVTWSSPGLLHPHFSSDAGLDDSPVAAGDGNGNWVVTWLSFDNLGGALAFGGNIFVSRSSDDGLTWSAPTYLNSNAPTDISSEFDTAPSIASDQNGNWVTVWWSESTLGGSIGSDADILVARSTDNGATWSAAAPLNVDAATDTRVDTDVKLATDGKGTWVAIWNPNEPPGFLVLQSTDNGATWSAPQPVSLDTTDDSGLEFLAEVATDGNGNWLLAWTSNDTLGGTLDTDLDILLARGVGCSSTPSTGCRQAAAGKSLLLIKDNADDAKDLLLWKWIKGDETVLSDFLTPTVDDPYALCLYDDRLGSSRLLLGIGARGGDTCGTKPCWKGGAKGFTYTDKDLTPEGLHKVVLRTGDRGKAKAIARAKGADLAMPALPLVLPATAQLRNLGTCWESTFSTPPVRNDDAMFKDKGD